MGTFLIALVMLTFVIAFAVESAFILHERYSPVRALPHTHKLGWLDLYQAFWRALVWPLRLYFFIKDIQRYKRIQRYREDIEDIT